MDGYGWIVSPVSGMGDTSGIRIYSYVVVVDLVARFGHATRNTPTHANNQQTTPNRANSTQES
eukprot:scaffold28307_cov26-Cyclotella_meneghiniana.AAC.1